MDGKAEALPLPDDSFDAVVSQFGFMFFDDKPRALGEMIRVLRPGGTLAGAVCGAAHLSEFHSAPLSDGLSRPALQYRIWIVIRV
jgi:ubiquinone/menaquinone biosynthesis C-methylase UbiE